MHQNIIESFLQKEAASFTRNDLIRYIEANNINRLNFKYVGGDGRLKTLSFPLNSVKRVDNILSGGERVDGSSLFSYIEAQASDLYVVPRYKTAFPDPFTEEPTLNLMCYFYTSEGQRLLSSPANLMKKAHDTLLEKTGMELYTMGELEYYVIKEREDLYPAKDQKGYHESPPFTKSDFIMHEAMDILSGFGAKIKYGHSEVGNFKEGEMEMEQYEIEFEPNYMEDSADHMILAKWVLRMLGYQYGTCISFAPKITVGKAGSGMHIHMKLMKNGKNMMIDNGVLSQNAKKAIAGILDLAPSLTAFGNTIPTSYLRLVPHQEAPTNICWGDRNRSVLVRVPLGWLGNASKMIHEVNPLETDRNLDFSDKQTVEFRCPDGSANIYLLMAGLAVAVRHGLEMKNALQMAESLYVNVNIFKEENKAVLEKLNQLPLSCFESAEKLLQQKEAYLKYDVFTEGILENFASELKQFNDKDLSEKLFGKHDKIRELVEKFMHCA